MTPLTFAYREVNEDDYEEDSQDDQQGTNSELIHTDTLSDLGDNDLKNDDLESDYQNDIDLDSDEKGVRGLIKMQKRTGRSNQINTLDENEIANENLVVKVLHVTPTDHKGSSQVHVLDLNKTDKTVVARVFGEGTSGDGETAQSTDNMEDLPRKVKAELEVESNEVKVTKSDNFTTRSGSNESGNKTFDKIETKDEMMKKTSTNGTISENEARSVTLTADIDSKNTSVTMPTTLPSTTGRLPTIQPTISEQDLMKPLGIHYISNFINYIKTPSRGHANNFIMNMFWRRILPNFNN